MSVSKKTAAMILANKKREEVASKTYTVERLLKRRKRKGRIEYLVKWKHWDRSHNSWEPEGNILDETLIESYKKKNKSICRRTLSPKKSIQEITDDSSPIKNNDTINKQEEDDDDDKEEEIISSTPPIDYWYPPICEEKRKIAITDITSDNVTITFRELI